MKITKAKAILPGLFFLILLTGCEAMLHGIITPNQCKKCEVVHKRTGEVVWEEQGCGGSKANIEDNAKIEAYEHNNEEFSNDCNYEVRCETWKEKDQNNSQDKQ